MIIDLPRKDLNNYFTLERSLYIKDSLTLYKDCLKSKNPPHFPQEVLEFVGSMPTIEGLNGPINLLRDGTIFGYESKYLKKHMALRDFVVSNKCEKLSFNDKKIILLRLLKTLKEINQYYILGDINSGNIMIDDSLDAKIIDWENGKPINSSIPIYAYYYLEGSYLQQDSLKMFINCVSILYNFDFEDSFCTWNFFDIKNFFKNCVGNSYINAFLNDYEFLLLTKSQDVPYFDEYMKHMKKPGNFQRQRCLFNIKDCKSNPFRN